MILRQNDTVLFQGDSITDANRDRSVPTDLGRGYALMASATLLARFPELSVTVLNRGVSGNRTQDLLARWQSDCVDLQPTVLSLLIGVNNVWRRYDSDDPTDIDTYRRELDEVLARTRDAGVREIVMLEPFVLPVPADRRGWRVDLDPKIAVGRELAVRYGARYVPLDGLFAAAVASSAIATAAASAAGGPAAGDDAARERAAAAYWAPDGVHPSPAGHGLIARAWIDAVCGPG